MPGFRRAGLFDAILVHGKHDVTEELVINSFAQCHKQFRTEDGILLKIL